MAENRIMMGKTSDGMSYRNEANTVEEYLSEVENQYPHIITMDLKQISTAKKDCGVEPFMVGETESMALGKFLVSNHERIAKNKTEPNVIAFAFKHIYTSPAAIEKYIIMMSEIIRPRRFDKIYLYFNKNT